MCRTTLSEEKWQTRVHLEVQMSSALALKSSTEYQRCLLSYARCLAKWVPFYMKELLSHQEPQITWIWISFSATCEFPGGKILYYLIVRITYLIFMCIRDTDEARLREVCEELLGPIRVDYSTSSPSNPLNNQKQWNSEILVRSQTCIPSHK